MNLALVTLLVLGWVESVLADYNVTVDNDSSSIIYSGEWGEVASPLAFDGTHAFSLAANGSARFTFTGIAVYYMAPLWSYPVTTELTLDGGPPVVVNLQGSSNGPVGFLESVKSAIVHSFTGLSNTQHTLVATRAPGGSYVVMDALVFTVHNTTSTSTNSSPSHASTGATTPTLTSTTHSSTASSAAAPAPPTSAASSLKSSHVKVIVGAVVGSIALLIILGLILFCCWRRRREETRTVSDSATIDETPVPRTGAPRSYSRALKESGIIDPELVNSVLMPQVGYNTSPPPLPSEELRYSYVSGYEVPPTPGSRRPTLEFSPYNLFRSQPQQPIATSPTHNSGFAASMSTVSQRRPPQGAAVPDPPPLPEQSASRPAEESGVLLGSIGHTGALQRQFRESRRLSGVPPKMVIMD